MRLQRTNSHKLKTGHREKETSTHLIGEWNGEIEDLAVELPFGFILHVGHLHFNSDRTLKGDKGLMETIQCIDIL